MDINNHNERDCRLTMTNAQMGDYINILSGLSETGVLGYAIARNKRKLLDAATEYIELRDKLLQKYGESKDGLYYSVPEENKNSYIEELGGIQEIEHEVEVFTIPEKEFYSGSLTSKQMDKLLWMVE